VEPAPTAEQLKTMLEAAGRAPDHKRLKPWRFIVLEGERKREISEVMAASLLAREPGIDEAKLTKERGKLERAPVVIAVATARLETSLPFEELLAATAAAIQNLLLVATDLGLGSMWRTGDTAYDSAVKVALGLSEQDFISGFVYLGTIPDELRREPGAA
jgi:nitroreductase